jgi:S1-C subfamily serine protease
MARILFSFLILLSFFSFSQKKSKKDVALIYLMRNGSVELSKVKATVFVSNQKGIEIPSGGTIEYTMFTEGEIKIFLQYENDSKNYFCKIKIKKGQKYYVCLEKDYIEEVDYDYIANFLNKTKEQIIRTEEDLNISAPQNTIDPDYSTVYILSLERGMISGHAGSMAVANQSPFNIDIGSAVAYRIYSEGEVSFQAHYQGVPDNYYATLKIKRGNIYFLYLTIDKLGEAVKEEVKDEVKSELLKHSGRFDRREENTDFAINPNTLKKQKGSGGQGTCFLISSEGYMITNFHCIENAREITIKGIDGDFTTKFGATLIASDPKNDLALLKVNNKNVKFITPVYQIRSSGVMQGEKVYALGFPKASAMGEEVKVTEGIISALSGIKKDFSNFQISAAINPGNSGGPLIDENGNLIGVIYAKSTIAESAGYAIKASYLEAFLKNIENFNYSDLTNTIKEKTLTEKIKVLKNFIFIVETGN